MSATTSSTPAPVTTGTSSTYVATEHEWNVCWAFAEKVIDEGTLRVYQMRQPGLTREKAVQDAALGKVAEIGIRHWLLLRYPGADVPEPDLEKHSKRQKRHGIDLDVRLTDGSSVRVHVKSCQDRRQEGFPLSGLFQENALERLPDDDLVVLMLVDALSRSISVLGACTGATARKIAQRTELFKSSSGRLHADKFAIHASDMGGAL